MTSQEDPLHIDGPTMDSMFYDQAQTESLPKPVSNDLLLVEDLFVVPKIEPLVQIHEQPSQSEPLNLPDTTAYDNCDDKPKNMKYISATSEILTEEQRQTYESVLAIWKPSKMSMVRCEYCTHEFRTKRALRIHCKREHASLLPDLKCDICDRHYDMPYKLKYHIQSAHPSEEDKLECEICHKIYNNSLNLSRHLRWQHSNVEPHPCPFCDLSFKSDRHMKRHVLNIHPPLESKVQCPTCLKVFKNDEYLQAHMQIHSSIDNKVKCEVCDKFFHSQTRLKKHLKIVHSTKPKIRCEKCSKEFAHPHYLKRHNASVHMDIEEQEYEHKCEQCGKRFKMLRYLNYHVQRHEQAQMREISRTEDPVNEAANSQPKKKPGRPRKDKRDGEIVKSESVNSVNESGSQEDVDSE